MGLRAGRCGCPRRVGLLVAGLAAVPVNRVVLIWELARTDFLTIRGRFSVAKDGQLIGFAPPQQTFKADRAMSGQRGLHFSTPPLDPQGKQVGSP